MLDRTDWTQDRLIPLDREDPRNFDWQNPGGDRIRFRLKTRYGRVVDFVLQYETPIPGASEGHLIVIRSDWSHLVPHYDVYNSRGDVRKILLPGLRDAKETMQSALDDLQQNWRRYRSEFFGVDHE